MTADSQRSCDPISKSLAPLERPGLDPTEVCLGAQYVAEMAAGISLSPRIRTVEVRANYMEGM